MEIIRRRRKRTKTYKYLKIYFSKKDKVFCKEVREDFFTKKIETKWYLRRISYRNDKDRFRTYKSENFEEIIVNEQFINKFNKALDKYIFEIREKKFKRICGI